MSIPVEITRLQTAKADIKEAIENNGVPVPNEARLDDYPPYIYAIQEDDPSNGHDYVEIAGMKWATMNVGATSVTDYGQYFQWGDTTGYLSGNVGTTATTYAKAFLYKDYKFSGGRSGVASSGLTKYNSGDTKTELDMCDDAVRLIWGGAWRIPTTDEYQALYNVTNRTYTDDYQGSGISGLVLTDKTDSSKVLFFPAAGYAYNNKVYSGGTMGVFWSSSIYSDPLTYAYGININLGNSSSNFSQNINRYCGLSVRGIINEREYPTIITAPSAKSGLVYNGNAQVLLSGGSADVSGTFTYGTATNAGNHDGTWLFTPTDLGRYNKVNGTAPASIAKAAGSVSTAPTAKSVTYNGNSQALVNAGSGTGMMMYKLGTGGWGTSIPTATTAGTYTVYYKASASTNYNESASGSVSVTIAKATGSVSTVPVNTNYTYNGTARAVASTGSGTGTMYYRLGSSGSFSTTMPTMTNAGSNTLYYYAAASANYNQSSTGSITVSVQKASQSAPTATGATVGNGSTATATASGGGGAGSIEWSNGSTRTSVGSQTTKARWSGNSNYNASPYSNEVTLKVLNTNGHAYVDLGLPSGTMWATMNVGASSVSGYGNYYMYGKGTSTYQQTSGQTEYTGTENPLSMSVDTARQSWGGSWHMPTRDQITEFWTGTTRTLTTVNGINCMKATSNINGNYIYIPLAGFYWYDTYDRTHKVNYLGEGGYIMSSTPGSSSQKWAYWCKNENGTFQDGVQTYPRKWGFSVRPVIDG